MSTDLSLRQALDRRNADPSLGVRPLAPPGSALQLRALIPPSGFGGGGGGSEPGFYDVGVGGYADFFMPDPRTTDQNFCAAIELKMWAAGPQGPPLNVDNEPLQLGDSYWIGARISFPDLARHFLAPYDHSSPGLTR